MQVAKLFLAVALASLTLPAHLPVPAWAATARLPSRLTDPCPARTKSAPKPSRPINLNLVMPLPRSLALPLSRPLIWSWSVRAHPRPPAPVRHRPVLTMEGILIGDYYLIPNLLFATDNRYDDVNIRERALRDDLNYQQSRLHGEIHIDPLTQLLRKHPQRLSDPGFQVVELIHRLLHGALPPPIRSVEQVLRLDVASQGPASAAQGLLVPPAQERTASPPPAPGPLDLRR